MLFGAIYRRAIALGRKKHAVWYLAILSFLESSISPILAEVLLVPLVLAAPHKWIWYGTVTTAASIVGGLFGYLLGHFAIELITPLLHSMGYWDAFLTAQNWFGKYGFWAVLVAAVSPIPYKVFTIAAGALSMFLPPFVLASIVGRGVRFYLAAFLLAWGGAALEQKIEHYAEYIGWAAIVLAIVGYFVLK